MYQFSEPCRTKGDIVFEHGDTINLEPCLPCICLNGVVKCDKIDEQTQCPVLECDVSEQFSVPDQCCKFCPGMKIILKLNLIFTLYIVIQTILTQFNRIMV